MDVFLRGFVDYHRIHNNQPLSYRTHSGSFPSRQRETTKKNQNTNGQKLASSDGRTVVPFFSLA